jgi:hypothetical protein
MEAVRGDPRPLAGDTIGLVWVAFGSPDSAAPAQTIPPCLWLGGILIVGGTGRRHFGPSIPDFRSRELGQDTTHT